VNVHGFLFCDLCHQAIGQLWNQPAVAPDLLPAPDFCVCEDCFHSWVLTDPSVNTVSET
jgi:hypothetical protein